MVVTIIVSAFVSVSAVGAPLSLKELEFLVRQKTPEATIMQEVTSRRLFVPLNAAAIQSLKELGASRSLISRLTASGVALDPIDAAKEAARQAKMKARVDESVAQDEAMKIMRDKQWNLNAQRLREARTVQGWLKDKLYSLNRYDLKLMENKEIDEARIFGFFHASMISGPSRDFAPRLAEGYTQLKKRYGKDFEIIFVSHDRDEFNQKAFMRTFGLTCPTMKLGSPDQSVLQFAGERLPWFVIIAETGKPMSKNAVDKEFLEPNHVLSGLEQILEAIHR